MKTTKLVATTLGVVTLSTGAAALALPGAQAATAQATPVTAANLPSVAQLQQTPKRAYEQQYFHKNTGDRAGTCQVASLKTYSPNVTYTHSYQAGRYHSATASIASFGPGLTGRGVRGSGPALAGAGPLARGWLAFTHARLLDRRLAPGA